MHLLRKYIKNVFAFRMHPNHPTNGAEAAFNCYDVHVTITELRVKCSSMAIVLRWITENM